MSCAGRIKDKSYAKNPKLLKTRMAQQDIYTEI